MACRFCYQDEPDTCEKCKNVRICPNCSINGFCSTCSEDTRPVLKTVKNEYRKAPRLGFGHYPDVPLDKVPITYLRIYMNDHNHTDAQREMCWQEVKRREEK